MTFSTVISSADNISTFLYIRARGLPYMWSTIACPASWDAGSSTVSYGGQTYTWWPTLASQELGPIEEEIEPWAGLVVPSDISITLVPDPNSLLFVNRYRGRGNITRLSQGLTYSGTTIYVDDTSAFAASGTLYLEYETITYTGKTSTTFIGCVRGRYGSIAVSHQGPGDADNPYSFTEIADFPLAIGGRITDVWLGTRDSWGQPQGSAPGSAEDKLIYVGSIQSARMQNLDSITINLQSLLGMVDREVGSRLPVFEPVMLDDVLWCKGPEFGPLVTILVYDGDGDQVGSPRLISSPIKSGFFSTDQIFSNGTSDSVNDVLQVFKYYTKWVDGKKHSVVRVFIAGEFVLSGTLVYSKSSLSDEMGFDGDVTAESVEPTTGGFVLDFVSQNPRPFLHLGYGEVNKSILVKATQTGIGVAQSTTDMITESDDIVPNYARIGDEIIKWAPDTKLPNTITQKAIKVLARYQFGSFPEDMKPLIIDADSDPSDNRITVCFAPVMAWPRAILYMLINGGGSGGLDIGYDVDIPGTGLGIPESLINTRSFTELISQDYQAFNFCISEPTKLRDILEPVLTTSQCYMYINDSGEIDISRITWPLVSDAEDEDEPIVQLGSEETDSLSGLNFDNSDSNVVNKITIANVGFNHGSRDGGNTINIINQGSRGTYGTGRSIEIEGKWFDQYSAEAASLQLAGEVFARWSTPFVLLDVAVQGYKGWDININDAVEVTSDYLPDVETLGFGSSFTGRVYATRKNYFGGQAWSIITVMVAADGGRASLWCPGILLTDIPATGICTYDTQYYSSVSDINYWKEGDIIRIYQRGLQEVYLDTRIATINTGTGKITFDTNPYGTVSIPAIVRYRDYTSVTDWQAVHVYEADTDGLIATRDRAYTYL